MARYGYIGGHRVDLDLVASSAFFPIEAEQIAGQWGQSLVARSFWPIQAVLTVCVWSLVVS